MRGDIVYSFEEFERLAEDYMTLVPPEPQAFDFELITNWEFDDFKKIFTFYFDDPWKLDEFYDKVIETPSYQETFDIGDFYKGVDRENLTIIVEAKEGGLY